jgi:O-antigen ligase
MLSHIREHIQFYLLLITWVLAGMFLGNIAVLVVAVSMVVLASREHFAEIIIGFFLILIFSDSRLEALQFSQITKKALIVLMILFLFLKRKVLETGSNRIFNIFLPFFIWSILMTLRSPVIVESMQKTISYIFLFLFIPVFGFRAMETDQRGFFRLMAYTIALYLLCGLMGRYISPESVYISERFMGFMGNPNGLGLMVFLFGILFDNMCRKDPEMISRNQKILIWAIIILNLLLCQSRASLFAFLVYMLFANLRALRGGLGVVVFLFLGISYGYILTNISTLITQLGLENVVRLENLEDGSGRVIAWEFAWQNIQDDFMLGKGFSYTEYVFSENYHLLSRMGHLGNAHNSFLTFWLDTGAIGLALFLVGMILLFIRLGKASPTALPLLYAILISANFESWLTASLNPNTISVLLTMTVMLYATEQQYKQAALESSMLPSDE